MTVAELSTIRHASSRAWRATYGGLSELGDQLSFFGRSLAGTPRAVVGYRREVLRLPPAAALGPGGSLDEFWTRASQHCGVVEVEIDGKLVYPF